MEVFDRLLSFFGPQGWWPARTPFEVVVGAILTQSVAWSNVEKAIANLEAARLLTPQSDGLQIPEAMAVVPAERLTPLIRPAGYYNAKAVKLRAFMDFLLERHGGSLAGLFSLPLAEAREQLLGVHGIGPETADSILLYAGGLPVFVVDAYTRRVMARLFLPDGAPPNFVPPAAEPPDDYEGLRRFFQERLPADPALYNEYHALIVALGKEYCRKSRTRCGECPLAPLCGTAPNGIR